MDILGKSKVKLVEIEAVIIRADGSIEDLGVVSSSDWKWYKPKTWKPKKESEKRIAQANEKVGD